MESPRTPLTCVWQTESHCKTRKKVIIHHNIFIYEIEIVCLDKLGFITGLFVF